MKAAQQGALDEAIELFSNAIRLTISNASAYNNRAQAKQLKGDLEGKRLQQYANFYMVLSDVKLSSVN